MEDKEVHSWFPSPDAAEGQDDDHVARDDHEEQRVQRDQLLRPDTPHTELWACSLWTDYGSDL